MFKRLCVALACLALALGAAYLWWLSPHYSVPILTYHSFDKTVGPGNMLSVSPVHFEQQMAYLKIHGYHVISLDELVEGVKAGKDFPHNTIVITIDDGYQNNYTYAYPILKKYGFPATIFLITDFIGANRDFLTWDEVREMSRHGLVFGAHTKDHVYLPAVESSAVLQDEIAGSKEALEKQLGSPVTLFAYPMGGFSDEAKVVVQKAGYKAACATNRGYVPRNEHGLYELKRVSIRNNDLSWGLAYKLSGYYGFFRKYQSGS